MPYLCYDVRGIQSFIFQVPRLRHIVGGSALIDRFDRETVPGLARRHTWQRIASAGGKGSFRVADEGEAARIQATLVEAGHRIGLDLRFGQHEQFSEAAHCAERLFPFLPSGSDLDGHPCRESGLYPVSASSAGGVHPIVSKRIFDRGDRMGRWFEERLLGQFDAASLGLPSTSGGVAFFRNVSPEPNATADDDALAASRSLGGRNRWAVVCMDGNDMGAQFRHAAQALGGQDDAFAQWVQRVSSELDGCATEACVSGIKAVVREWRQGVDLSAVTASGEVVIPVRPLVVGGDDIVALVHSQHAFSFASEASRAFAEKSRQVAREAQQDGIDLWPATGAEISISAGILFAPVTLPLSSAIPYAESLLASSKGRGRLEKADAQPAPACIDWEIVTESLLDHPALRRQREMRFQDLDIDEIVELTRRPYRLDELPALESLARQLEDVPTGIRAQVLPSMRAAYDDRLVFQARLGKQQALLAAALQEPRKLRGKEAAGRWIAAQRPDGWARSTDVVDALLLLEERSRMDWEDR